MIIKTIPVIESIPNIRFVLLLLTESWNEENKMKDAINGKASVATIAARVGSGLKLKCSVSENGNDAMWISPETVIHTGIIPITMRIGDTAWLVLLLSLFVESPIEKEEEKEELVVIEGLNFLLLLLSLLFWLLLLDNIPNRAPILLSAMPIVSTECEGLSKPSKPKAECQAKSKGPAETNMITPMVTNFIGKGKSINLLI